MAKTVQAAGLLIYRQVSSGFEYLLLQASYPPYHWTPPKGHVDPGEDELTAALRETQEEAGINADQLDIDKEFKYVQSYVTPKEGPKTVAYWLAKLKGPLEVVLSHEHKEMKWLGLQESKDLSKFKEMAEMLDAADKYLRKKAGTV